MIEEKPEQSMSSNKGISPEEERKLYIELNKMEEQYEKRFHDQIPVGPFGLDPREAISEIKKALKTGKPYEGYPVGKNVIL
jgi:hypothetical protein